MRSRGIVLAAGKDGTFVGTCPFHQDRGLSTLRVHRGSWRCEDCGREGGAAEFLQTHDGISLRHARELLTSGEAAVIAPRRSSKRSTVRRLPCPLDPEADDGQLLEQVVLAYDYDRNLAGGWRRRTAKCKSRKESGLTSTWRSDAKAQLEQPCLNRS
ncbi:MAG: hypothetical protein KJ072_27730 [Verrucomicrobia bacterium]|nr:hypothetical protein [Verrucomicrobiota bacterium]